MPEFEDAENSPVETCEDVLDLLHCLIENELEDAEAEKVLSHLANCKTCRKALSEHVKLRGLLSANMPWLGGLYFNRVASPRH